MQTTPAVVVPRESSVALAVLSITGICGTGTTSIRIRCYRGAALGGTQVFDSGSMTFGIIASGLFGYGFAFLDTLLSFATIQYTMSYQQNGAGGASSFPQCTIAGLLFG